MQPPNDANWFVKSAPSCNVVVVWGSDGEARATLEQRTNGGGLGPKGLCTKNTSSTYSLWKISHFRAENNFVWGGGGRLWGPFRCHAHTKLESSPPKLIPP